MAFADKGMAWITLFVENLASLYSVADVGERAVAVDRGRVGAEYAYVVEHGCLEYEIAVYFELQGVGDVKGLGGHAFGMGHEDVAQGSCGIIVINDFVGVHGRFKI